MSTEDSRGKHSIPVDTRYPNVYLVIVLTLAFPALVVYAVAALSSAILHVWEKRDDSERIRVVRERHSDPN